MMKARKTPSLPALSEPLKAVSNGLPHSSLSAQRRFKVQLAQGASWIALNRPWHQQIAIGTRGP